MLGRLVGCHLSSGVFEPVVVSLTTLGPIGERLRAEGIRVHALGMRSLADVPRVTLQLARLLRAERPAIVQTWMYHADLIGGISTRVAIGRQAAIVWNVRTTHIIAGTARSTGVIRSLCARLSRYLPDAIVCAAEASRRAHAEIGYDSARMVVIPNGFDVHAAVSSRATRRAQRASIGWGDVEVVVGFVARFNSYKDPETFVRAAAQVAGRYPSARFLCIGLDMDGSNSELMSWINATGCADRFVLLGDRHDVPQWLSALDVFCLSSRSEGFPNVVGEAMAAGIPTVVTDVGDAAALVGETGVVVRKEDPGALADGIIQVLSMSEVSRTRLGDSARARIVQHYSLRGVCKRYESLYGALLPGARIDA
ncbi:glycosyltransferase [soil metagenome]